MEVVEYLDKESGRGVIYAFQAGDPSLSGKVNVRELEPDREYRITSLIGSMPERKAKGSELAENLELNFRAKGASIVLSVEPI